MIRALIVALFFCFAQTAPAMEISPDDNGRTPLHHAVDAGDTETIKQLLADGHPLDPTDNYGLTPLHLAVWQDSPDVAELLLEHGANVQIQDEQGRTPLFLAIFVSNLDVAKSLVAHGASLQTRDYDGRTVLHSSAMTGKRFGHEDATIAWLVHHYMDINAKDFIGHTPLMIAVANGQHDRIKTLLRFGANTRILNINGETALDIAKNIGDTDIIYALTEN